MDDEIAVSVENLSKDFMLPRERKNSLKERIIHFGEIKYDKLHALRDINFEVKGGEFFGVVGRNGSGKSTLLKIIGGIYQPTKGKVTINGTLTPFIELGIGFNPELTGRENVYLNGAILGLTRKEINAKYQVIVDFAELEKFMDQKLKNYSSGMQVRLAFSIAIQAHNDILLIDEVLAVGDERFQNKCLEFFHEIKKDQTKTTIFVSHDMGMIQRYCDRAVVLHDGKQIYIGDSQTAAYEYKVLNFPDEIQQSEESRKSKNTGTQDIIIESLQAREIRSQNQPPEILVTLKTRLKNQKIKGEPMQVGLAFYTTDDEHVSGPNNLLTGRNIVAKNSTIIFRVPNHFLSTGRYKITAGLFPFDSTTINYDWHDREYRLAIARKTNEMGPAIMGGEWTQK